MYPKHVIDVARAGILIGIIAALTGCSSRPGNTGTANLGTIPSWRTLNDDVDPPLAIPAAWLGITIDEESAPASESELAEHVFDRLVRLSHIEVHCTAVVRYIEIKRSDLRRRGINQFPQCYQDAIRGFPECVQEQEVTIESTFDLDGMETRMWRAAYPQLYTHFTINRTENGADITERQWVPSRQEFEIERYTITDPDAPIYDRVESHLFDRLDDPSCMTGSFHGNGIGHNPETDGYTEHLPRFLRDATPESLTPVRINDSRAIAFRTLDSTEEYKDESTGSIERYRRYKDLIINTATGLDHVWIGVTHYESPGEECIFLVEERRCEFKNLIRGRVW